MILIHQIILYIYTFRSFLYCKVICLTHCISVEDPCRNNGICIYPEPEIPGQLPRCQCLPGFYGDICEFDVNECQVRRINCNNRGESLGHVAHLCLYKVGSYTSLSVCLCLFFYDWTKIQTGQKVT